MPKDTDKRDTSKDDDLLKEARERYADAEDGWSQVKIDYLEDYRFARLGEQWPADIMQRRRQAGRPTLTINRLPPMIRQVVNAGRQNRPGISVRPMDSGADIKTADVMAGIIRHIENISNADVAYDTSLDTACSGGLGFIGIDIDYACDDTFDLELYIRSIPNPMAVLWDPLSEAFDSSDWNYAFISEEMERKAFEEQYPDYEAEASNFVSDSHISGWYDKETVRLARYYERKKEARKILLLMGAADGQPMVVDAEKYAVPETKALYDLAGLTVARERSVESYRIIQRLITGKEVLDEKSWRASAIPIIPVWGEELNVEGRRYFRSMIHDAVDAQRIHNYSRSTATEVVSLAPRIPFLGEEGTFDVDREKWDNINTENWGTIEYKKGAPPPARPQYSGVPDGAMTEAAAALDDIKFIVGMPNPAMGMPDARVISGKAKRMERQESDMGHYHLIDNQNRGVRAVGQLLLEMIPQVYTGARIARIIGADGKASMVPVNQQHQDPKTGIVQIFDVTGGKYDLAIQAGPSYSTRREEASEAITSFISAAPGTAAVLGPMLAKMSDWPEADKVSDMLATMMPPQARAIFDGTSPPPPGPPPELLAKQAEAQADMAMQQQKMQADMALSHQKAQQDFQLEQQRAANRNQVEQMQAQADIAVMREKAQAEMQIARERAAMEMQLKQQEAELAAKLKMIGAVQNPASQIAPGVQ